MPPHANAARKTQRLELLLRGVIVFAAAAFVLAFVLMAIARLGIPAPLTDVKLGTVQHVQRVLDRQPAYGEPSIAFVPLDYAPMYYYASAAVAALVGNGYPALRLTSLLSTLAAFALVAVWTRRETGSWWAGTLAAGLFAATYRMTGAWFDVERVDALCVALLVAALYCWRRSRSTASTVAAASFFVLSALTKQTTGIVAFALAAFLILTDRRRGIILAAVLAAGAAVSTGILMTTSGGWYSVFVLGVGTRGYGAIEHPNSLLAGIYEFAGHEVFGVLPFALLLPAPWLIRAIRVRSRLPAGSFGFFATAWCAAAGAALMTQLLHTSRANVLMPVYAITAVMAAISAAELMRIARDSSLEPARALVLATCVAQFAVLGYIPWHLVHEYPGPAHDEVIVVSGTREAPRVTAQSLAWADAWRTPHADLSAVADLIVFAPPEISRRFGERMVHDLCAATDDHPVVVSALLFDREWQETVRAEMTRPLPLPPSIDAALSTCGRAAVQ